jgi:hypothetical protein
MSSENSKAIVVATIIIIGIAGAALLLIPNSDNPDGVPNTSGIETLTIYCNSTDVLYPELAEADFIFLANGSWRIDANFMNDSEGYYEYLEIYDRSFIVTPDEVESINAALYEGLNDTSPSEISVLTLLEPSPHIWYQIEITYTNGSWVYLSAFQTDQGSIIFNSGTGTPNTNLLDGIVLEPLSALDCLVTAIYNLFSNHID